MPNISTDLKDEHAKDLQALISKVVGAYLNSVTIGDLTKNTCIMHGETFRSYAISGAWYNDFCYPCFSREKAMGLQRPGIAKSNTRYQKHHWAQG